MNVSPADTKLSGGINTITKVGQTVRRPTGPWSNSVHRLLTFLTEHGFEKSSQYLGLDDDGNEMLSFTEGSVSGYPMEPYARSEDVLISAAKVLREYHDRQAGFEQHPNDIWQLPTRQPAEVICHGDYGPHNVVIKDNKVVGIIDFDIAHPGPRIWDVAYAVYRFAPLTAPSNSDGFGSVEQQADRLRIFCDAYSLSTNDKTQLLEVVQDRLDAMINSILKNAKAGDAAYQAHIEAGHVRLYRDDKNYIEEHKKEFNKALD